MSAFKAQATMRELLQRVSLQLPSATITQAQDSNGLPAAAISYGAFPEVLMVKINLDGNAGRVDGLGLAQRVYSPHIAQTIQDSDRTSADSKVLKARMDCILAKLGMKLDIHEDTAAHIAASSANGFDALYTGTSTELVTIRSDEINPLTQSQ